MPSSTEQGGTEEAVRGLSAERVSALRYNSSTIDPFESTSIIISFIKPGSRVLDIGCGTGTVSHAIRRERDIDILGIEPNRERADAARKLGLTVIDGVYTADIPAEHGRFDYIILADVLEHLEDPFALLASLQDALTGEGRLIASLPNVAHWTVRLNLLRGRFDYQPTGIMDATHLRWFTKASVTALFEAAGYEIDVITHSAGAWMPEYRRWPFSAIKEHRRPKFINWLASRWHGLFACQHVLSAKRRTTSRLRA